MSTMKKNKLIAGLLICIMGLCFMTACGNKEVNETAKEGVAAVEEVVVEDVKENADDKVEIEVDPAYKLVWEDNFDGTELNRDDWNVELHDPGWVNAEWQEYVDCEDNIYVKDGNLILQPIKMKVDHKDYYTSGRVNTQNKHDFLYGRFEARLKVPSGMGFLPAFWMMPTDESFYGQWPKCGEIDIMEVMGQTTDTLHGTLHFGEPHAQKQGTYVLEEGNFADEFHVFACEWEPGEMRFYVDNELYFTEHEWYTKRNGFDEMTYPAPFDQPFYMILNVAVGGSWVGYPDATTEFGENAQMVVDYVKVYQKDSYDENVSMPEKEVVFKEADATGNYINNSDFSSDENLEDDVDWKFLLFNGGKGAASISDGAIHITTENVGTEEYSVQLVQPNIPMENGGKYKLSFEAYADEDRTMITTVSAPDLNFIRYFDDVKLELTTKPQLYEYEFFMMGDNDANGRVEFNMGKQGSTATIHISNVRVEKMDQVADMRVLSSLLPDGNYIYNSTFDRGDMRLGYWNVENNCAGANVSVTNKDLVRELKVEVPDTVASLEDIKLKQSLLALEGGKSYKLFMNVYAEEEKTLQLNIAGQTFEVPVTKENTKHQFTVVMPQGQTQTELELLLGAAGTTYIDNVRMYEHDKIINGNFTNETVGYEVYVDEAANATYLVDELSEGGALGFDIFETTTDDWKIQLRQENIRLEKGKWYRVSFDAKTNLNRDLKLEVKADGEVSEETTAYMEEQICKVNLAYHTFDCTFQMTEETDENAVLCISLGAVSDKQISKKHTIFIDNITIQEAAEAELKEKDN